MKNVAFISTHIAFPPLGGPWRRSYLNFLALSRCANTHLYLLGELDQLNSIDRFGVEHFRSVATSITCLHNSNYRNGYSEFIKEVKKRDIDVIWLCYAGLMLHWIPRIKKDLPGVKIVADTDSVWSDFLLREIPYEKNYLKKIKALINGLKKRNEEKKYGKMADVITAVSEIDKKRYESFLGNNVCIDILPNIIVVKDYLPENNLHVKPIPGEKVCFTGTMTTTAHEDAVQWLSHKVMPYVWEKLPECKFYVVGRDPTKSIQECANDRVIVTGKVESVLPYLYNSICSVIPVRFESGTRSKIIEAFASKVPVVSTKLGYEGLPLKHRHHLMVADNEKEFAEDIILLKKNKSIRDTLISNGLEFASTNYDFEVAARKVKDIVTHLTNDSRTVAT